MLARLHCPLFSCLASKAKKNENTCELFVIRNKTKNSLDVHFTVFCREQNEDHCAHINRNGAPCVCVSWRSGIEGKTFYPSVDLAEI